MESLTDLIDVYDTSISKKSDIVFTGNLLKELRKSKVFIFSCLHFSASLSHRLSDQKTGHSSALWSKAFEKRIWK
jgi:hypothetical protein